MKKKISSLLIALLSCTGFQAQNSAPLINSQIPPSPISAVFRQFAGYTPNLATGTVNVPVDLYNVQVGDFSLPISMQYYAQGIKMTDDPYPLGYGWILSPGLRITRTVMGRADMYYPMDVQTSPEDVHEYGRLALYDRTGDKHPSWYSDELTDTQHDMFTVHLPGGNHTFFLNEKNGVYTAVSTNNLLDITSNGLSGFTVKDENGTVYEFGYATGASGEYVEYYPGEFSIATSWMLRKVTLPTGREITLTWQKVRHATLGIGNQFGGDILQDAKENLGSVPEDPTPAYTEAATVGNLAEYGSYNEVLHLKQIAFPGGTVDFTYLATSNPLLTDIAVKNIYGSTVKEISFTYGTGSDQPLLQSVDLSDEGLYSFTYNATRFEETYGQDWWGYYNGRSNRSLVPQVYINTYNTASSYNVNNYLLYGNADRSIDATAMQACMLTRVTYPTGGYTAFEYEPHRFSGSMPTNTGLGSSSRFRLTEGGGLRIRKVTTSTGGDAPAVVKTYKYGAVTNEANDAVSGLANVLYEPTLETFIDELCGFTAEHEPETGLEKVGYNHRQLLLNTQSGYMRYALNAPALWYSRVAEYVEGAGRTVYTFSRPVPENVQASHSPVRDFSFRMPVTYNTLFSKGCVLTGEVQEKRADDGSYTPVKETVYSYSVIEETDKRISDAFVSRTNISFLENGPDFEYTSDGLVNDGTGILNGSLPSSPVYMVNPLDIRFIYERLNSMTTTTYSGTQSLTVTEDYSYSGYQLVRKTTTTSSGQSQVMDYSYPAFYTGSNSALLGMKSRNMLAVPYQTVKTTGGDTETVRTEFALFNGSFYKPYKQFFKKNSGTEVCRAQYDYDTAGNVRSITENGILKSSILWGYNYTVPVAVIRGLDYAGVSGLVSSTYLNNLNGSSASVISTALGNVRTAIGSNGLVTTYTYTPLVGITSMTGPNGNKVTYSYDTAGRLSTVKNHSGYTEQSFEYHLLNE